MGRSNQVCRGASKSVSGRSEEHTSELQSQSNLVCRLLLEKKKLTNALLRTLSRLLALCALRLVLATFCARCLMSIYSLLALRSRRSELLTYSLLIAPSPLI